MLSSKTRRLFLKISKWGYALGFGKVRWDVDTDSLVLSNSRFRIWWEKIQLLLVTVYELFLCWQSVRSLVSAQSSLSDVPLFYLAGLWLLMNCNFLGSRDS